MKLNKIIKSGMVDEYVKNAGDTYMQKCDDTAIKIREEWDKKIIKYTPLQIKKSKHPDKQCGFCDQLGCDIFVKKYNAHFHKKCFRYLVRQSIASSLPILKATVLNKKKREEKNE